jgi:uncharacterized membrane protein YdjX (TVP38/TMEM64 family)
MIKFSFTYFNKIWLSLAVINLLFIFFFPDWFSRESIASFLSGFGPISLAVYALMSMGRAFFLIPSTPFIIAGAITFPESPVVIWFISSIGVVVGAYLVYSLPSFGGYDKFLDENYPTRIAYLKEKMCGRYVFWIIMGWAFFPFVPTDAVCYVAGIAKISYKKVIVPLLIGQLPLATAYIFLGTEIGEWLRV